MSGVAVRYLENRGIILPVWPEDLREHPDLMVYENGKATGKKYPAIVAVIRNVQGEPVGLHLTFLEKDGSGKAPIENPRRIIGVREGSTRGTTVRLFEPQDGTIGLSEGLETAIAAYLLARIPTWAALNAGGGSSGRELPPEIRRVVIFADHDVTETGLKTALKAYDRLTKEGRTVEIRQPREIGDYNDELIKEARLSVLA